MIRIWRNYPVLSNTNLYPKHQAPEHGDSVIANCGDNEVDTYPIIDDHDENPRNLGLTTLSFPSDAHFLPLINVEESFEHSYRTTTDFRRPFQENAVRKPQPLAIRPQYRSLDWLNHLDFVRRLTTARKRQNNLPIFLLSNVRSLLSKLEDLEITLKSNHATGAFITETWLSDQKNDAAVEINGFPLARRNRTSIISGDICAFIRSVQDS